VRDPGELVDRDLAGEALDAVVAGVDLEDRAGARVRARLAVVAAVGAVGGADLAHPRAGGGDQLGETEPRTGRDEPPRAPHPAPAGRRRRPARRDGTPHRSRRARPGSTARPVPRRARWWPAAARPRRC